jgi:hypothetical protein
LRAARFRCVRGAGHAPFLSHPEVVLTEARALLDAHAPLPRRGGVPRAVRDGTALSRRG